MTSELGKTYDPAAIQDSVHERWAAARAFAATPDERDRRYVVMMPLPNVTGALHMGHAMDNVMQDLLIRWHRMRGDNTLWMAGTDHAGIATQAVVEKRLYEDEGKTRHDIGREALVERIWEWKDQYQARIVAQQQQMGCSCDWERQRFTMDAVCSAAVRETFFRFFRDGLVYKGDRLVNWDCHLQTAVADDEVVHETVQGHFWHLRYPVVDPGPGEPTQVVVATTRPETMLGDTAVACHPAPPADLPNHAELATLARMAREGRKVRLPLQEREIPLILDDWAKPELGSGCVKITPAHDPNDYEVWQRNPEIGAVNILEPDGTLSAAAGAYAGLDRFDARERVLADLEARGLIAEVEDREIEIGHSDRSKTPVEPYLSKQWFVRMGDVDGGVRFGRGTDKAFDAAGLAQAAMDAATSGALSFHPDSDRYANTYLHWLAEKRDWCISRQLWWGHRIPIFEATLEGAALARACAALGELDVAEVHAFAVDAIGRKTSLSEVARASGPIAIQACPRDLDADAKHAGLLTELGFVQETDVLDTWFSSALWPHSTLGWPDPSKAGIDEGQAPLAAADGRPDTLSYYYPGSCLVTGRDIITLWVVRMVVFGLYNLGDLPFADVFIHANILDGRGERMSKSKGNGVDPVDIIDRYGADAMRYVLCDMQTGAQDIRLPVQAVSPYTGKQLELAKLEHGRSVFTYVDPEAGKEFDVLGSSSDLPAAEILCERFEVGRNFCNKLWNAARFVLMNLDRAQVDFAPLDPAALAAEDRWILSRLALAVEEVGAELDAYNPSAAISRAREFLWAELCDWYLEWVKARLADETEAPVVRRILACALDQSLRLLHPFVPFVTEALWAKLGELAPRRGVDRELGASELAATAAWPEERPDWRDEGLEGDFALLRELVRGIRDLRARHQVPPAARPDALLRAEAAELARVESLAPLLSRLAGLASLRWGADDERPALAATQVVGQVEIHLAGVLDPVKERGRLLEQIAKVEQQDRASRAKLANENFVARAPAEVVEGERGRLGELEQRASKLRASLAALEEASSQRKKPRDPSVG